jgi:hypothetical protein
VTQQYQPQFVYIVMHAWGLDDDEEWIAGRVYATEDLAKMRAENMKEACGVLRDFHVRVAKCLVRQDCPKE